MCISSVLWQIWPPKSRVELLPWDGLLLCVLLLCWASTDGLRAQTRSYLSSKGGTLTACPDWSRQEQWVQRLRLAAGVGQVSQRSTSTPPNLAPYQALRDSTQELQLHYLADVRIETIHRSGLLLRFGAGYQLYRSRVSLREAATTTETLTEVRDPFDGTVLRVDTTRVTGYRRLLTPNRQQTLSWAAGLGYQWPRGWIRPYVLAEAEAAFLIASRGKLPRPDEQIELLERSSPYLTRRPLFHYSATAGIDFGLTRDFDLGLSVTYKRLGSLAGTADPLDLRQNLASAALNLVYYWPRRPR